MRSFLGLLLVLAVAVTLGLLAPTAQVALAADGAEGQRVFLGNQCNLCHSVEAAGIEAKTKSEKLKGPDLGGFRAEAGFDVDRYLRKEVEKDGAAHRREFKGSDEELQALLGWLASQ